MHILRIIVFNLLCVSIVWAQSLNYDYPANACLNENIRFKNLSPNSSLNYYWDLCEGELLNPIASTSVHRVNEIDQAAGIKTVEDNGLYYSFVIDRAANSLHRLEFGLAISNTPSRFAVTITGGVNLSSPQGFNLIKVAGSWYGFITSSGNNKIFRLDFGSSLANTPVAVEINFLTHLNVPIEIEIAKEGSDYFLLVANFSGNNLVVAKLGNAIVNQPEPGFNVIALSGAGNPYGFSIRKFDDGVWRGVVGSFSNSSFHAIVFNNGLSQPASVTNITNSLPVVNSPVKLVLETWGKENVLMVMSVGGIIHRIHFKRGLYFSSVESTSTLNSSSFGASLAFSLFYENGNWRAITFSNSTRDLRTLFFTPSCNQVNIPFYSGFTPPIIFFDQPGIYDITLRAEIEGIFEKFSVEILIDNVQAPEINISSQGVCVSQEVSFTSLANSPLSQVEWDFGDSGTSMDVSPTHQYAFADEYEVILSVEAVSGCSNFTSQTLKIFNTPVADFSVPASLICTNNEFTFSNNTIDEYEGNLTYRWHVGSDLVSTMRDLKTFFLTPGDKQIKLAVFIPGCENEILKVVSPVVEGPAVNFNVTGKCQNEIIKFENNTTGTVTSYSWDFGDGQISNMISPNHTYSTQSNYQVTLTATNDAGCMNTFSNLITIYSKPQTNFSIPLPPFSCSGKATQFTDLTPNPFDSNLSSWSWDFDDAGSSSSLRNPQHLYAVAGDYQVSLTATTNFGCSTTFQKSITIAYTPQAIFSNSAPCLGVPVNFTDASVGTIQSRQWQIENASFTTQNPVYTFNSSGGKNVSLSVTATNGCVGSLLKNIVVPVVLAPDFYFSKNCINQQTEFSDITIANDDPIANRLWTITGFGTGSNNPQVFSFSTTGNYNVKLSVTTQTGCSYAVQKNVAITTAPQTAFIMAPAFGEPPLQVQFTNTSSNASSYLWQFNDAANSTSALASPAFTFTELGNYSVNLNAYNAQGCLTSFSKTVIAVVPLYDITLTNLELIQLPNNTIKPIVNIHNKSNVPITGLPIRFDFSGGSVIRDYVNTEILPGENFRYVVSFDVPVTSQLNFICAEAEIADPSPKDNKLCLSISKPVSSIAPHPNPVSKNSELIVEWISHEQRNIIILLTNALGQIILQKEMESKVGLNTIYLPLASLRAGLYFLQIDHQDFISSFRVVVSE